MNETQGTPGSPVPAGATQVKWAGLWFDDDLTDASDIVVEMVNVCPPGGGEVSLSSDYSYNLAKRVTAFVQGGECLEIRVGANHIPEYPDTMEKKRGLWCSLYHHGGLSVEH